MANILTNFLRIVAHPGQTITAGEAEWIIDRMLNDRGSYNVPVAVRRAPDGSLCDIQAGSMKNGDFYDFWEDHPGRYAVMWERFYDEGGTLDYMYGRGPDGEESAFGPCWYGFDEVRVNGLAAPLPDLGPPRADWEPLGCRLWRAKLDGRYRTGNERTDIEKAGPRSMEVEWNPPVTDVPAGALATPTTPAHWSSEIDAFEPAWLEPLVVPGDPESGNEPQAERVELLWRGRVVHRAQMEYDADLDTYEWEQRSADDWDNCLNPEYLASMRSLHRWPG